MDVATKLIEKSFEYLGASKPLLTVNTSKIELFSNIIKNIDGKLVKKRIMFTMMGKRIST